MKDHQFHLNRPPAPERCTCGSKSFQSLETQIKFICWCCSHCGKQYPQTDSVVPILPSVPESPALALVAQLAGLMEEMTPDQRLEVFEKLTDKYCEHCGSKQSHDGWGRCQCWNDE